MRAKWIDSTLAAALIILASSASARSPSAHPDLQQQVSAVDAAYRNLNPNTTQAYNEALATLIRQMERETPAEFQAQMAAAGVKLNSPAVKLPLTHFYAARPQERPAPAQVGAPIVIEFDTTHASVYPPDGLLVAASAIYRRINGHPQLALITGRNTIELHRTKYPLALDARILSVAIKHQFRQVARTGFRHMLHPGEEMPRTQIYLVDPYDPNKIPVLMVHGLQSTPVAFLKLVNALRLDPEFNTRFQVWTFLYGTGEPVMFNALRLRQELERTVRALDPHDHDFATRHIVVLGHSMGGLMTHTLVSSSGNKLWNAFFQVPPERLRGDPATVRLVSEALHFRRNRRVLRAIFLATPHRGSKLADSWIGHLAQSLIHLSPDLQSGMARVANKNMQVTTPQARVFVTQMNFSAIHTLSPRDPVLQTLATLPIEVPFHSIIGQRHPGPLETSSDGAVTYASAHLNHATSELIVRSNHDVADKTKAQAEIARILRLERRERRELNFVSHKQWR